jgi:hypothetical protein
MTAEISEKDIPIIQNLLDELCADGKIISKTELYAAFRKKTKTEIEEYRFKLDLPVVMRDDLITGYEITVGRKGGISKKQELETINIQTSFGNYTGKIKKSKLLLLINDFEKTH